MAFASLKETIKSWFISEPLPVECGGTGQNSVDLAEKVYSLEYHPGDTLSVAVATAGYVTTSSTSIRFTVPLARPLSSDITGITVTADNGLILRQNGSYTHGSTSSTGAVPSAYSFTFNKRDYIQVAATMSSTTNATNNDTVGIVWNATLTFS